MITIQGKGVSSGIGMGPLYFYRRTKAEIKTYTVEDVSAEWLRFKGAQSIAIEQLGVLAEKARAEAGDEAALLFETHQMLAEDLPVILSVGMNFPKVWEKETLNFYRICGENVPASNKVRAHFVVVTGMDEEWLQISTWGVVRYIRRTEYEDFMKRQSGSVLSNLLLLRKI